MLPHSLKYNSTESTCTIEIWTFRKWMKIKTASFTSIAPPPPAWTIQFAGPLPTGGGELLIKRSIRTPGTDCLKCFIRWFSHTVRAPCSRDLLGKVETGSIGKFYHMCIFIEQNIKFWPCRGISMFQDLEMHQNCNCDVLFETGAYARLFQAIDVARSFWRNSFGLIIFDFSVIEKIIW